MKRKKLLWQIYLSYLTITILALMSICWYATSSFKSFYYSEAVTDLEIRAIFLKHNLEGKFAYENGAQLDSLCKKLGRETATRITLIKPSGKVMGDSEKNPYDMDNHIDRVEVIDAIKTGKGISIRYSHTINERMIYLAMPIKENNKLVGILRTARTLTAMDSALKTIYSKILVDLLVTAFFIAVINLIISRRIVRPLEEMKRGVERFGKGDLSYRLHVPNLEEVGSLAQEMNSMASQLNQRISKLGQQNNEKEALLSSMSEGVLGVDLKENIIFMNQTAAQIFDIGYANLEGRGLQEVIRNSQLHNFVRELLTKNTYIVDELILRKEKETYIKVSGSVLRDANGCKLGGLVVINNVTRLRQLESLRQDFVANVSHELKTPITSIKGFVETLLDGAMEEPDSRKNFLEIIKRQSERLQSIIEDLLQLSRLEKDEETEGIDLRKCSIRKLLEAAIKDCETEQSQKNIKILLDCDSDIFIYVNFQLLEQAVVNLIDNAIKYSKEGSTIKLEVNSSKEITIKVCDEGQGIPKEDLERIFERFYRVDKARSRKLGGTGLGLAIVKHIVQAHKGYVSVESQISKGSEFCIHLNNLSATSGKEINA